MKSAMKARGNVAPPYSTLKYLAAEADRVAFEFVGQALLVDRFEQPGSEIRWTRRAHAITEVASGVVISMPLSWQITRQPGELTAMTIARDRIVILECCRLLRCCRFCNLACLRPRHGHCSGFLRVERWREVLSACMRSSPASPRVLRAPPSPPCLRPVVLESASASSCRAGHSLKMPALKVRWALNPARSRADRISAGVTHSRIVSQ